MHHGRNRTKPQIKGYTMEEWVREIKDPAAKRKIHKKDRQRGNKEARFDPIRDADDELEWQLFREMWEFEDCDSFGDYFDEEMEAYGT
jgi:hypothetical protein